MKYDIVKRTLSFQFRRLGRFVARKPSFIILACLASSLILGSGIHKVSRIIDLEYLYSPTNGRAKAERDAVESLFPVNLANNYDFLRVTRFGKMGSIQARRKDDQLMLTEEILEELYILDKRIRNVTISYNDRIITYDELCSKTIEGCCLNNFPLSLRGTVKEMMNKIKLTRYPIEKINHLPIIPAVNLGGVVLDVNNYITDFKAARFFYTLDYSTEEKEIMASLWENEFLKEVSTYQFKYLDVERFTGSSMNKETSQITEMSFYLLLISAPIVVSFTSLSCITLDFITSKPWLGLASCTSVLLSTFAAFGLLLYCNAYYVDLNIAVSFLMLGIGIDDSFILLASWRRTNPKDSVEDRIGQTFSEAAVSVTITSLTNLISFCVGILSPYGAVRIFSIYSAFSLVFAYVYQLLFFGSCLALDGYREEKQLNGFTFMPVKKKEIAGFLISKLKKNKFCSSSEGCLNLQTSSNHKMSFYHDFLGSALGYNNVKAVILVMFVAYFVGGVYCLRFIKEGLQYLSVFPFSSFVYNYTITHYKYFTDYPHRIHLVVNTTLDYSDKTIQNDINDLLIQFQTLPNMAELTFLESWLSEYLSFINDPLSRLSLRGYNLTHSQDFLEALRGVFLRFKWAQRFKGDILFNDNGTKIIASRFFLQSKGVRDANAEKKLVESLRNIADKCKYSVHIHNLWFVIYDQYMGVVETTIQTICIASIAVTVIFMVFIPNISCAVCVMLTITCIQIGVIGYMSLWNVNLDSVSMIILVICTGFSVDYAAHISYSYISCKNVSLSEKIRISLHSAGHPIVQGCVSTILAVCVLYFGPSYMFVIFFKIIVLVMMLAGFHGIFLLPVLLSINDSIVSHCCTKNSRHQPVNKNKDLNALMELTENNAIN